MSLLSRYRAAHPHRAVLDRWRTKVEASMTCYAIWAGYAQTCNEVMRHPPCPVCIAQRQLERMTQEDG